MGPLAGAHALLGYVQPRLGAGIPYTVPRGTYWAADGAWVAVSTSPSRWPAGAAPASGRRTTSGSRFAGRVEHREELDARLADWVAARDAAECWPRSRPPRPPLRPSSHGRHRRRPPRGRPGDHPSVDGVPMQGLVARLSATPGRIRWAGRPLGADDGAGPPSWPDA